MTGRHAPHYMARDQATPTHQIDSIASVVLAESLIRPLVQPVVLGERVTARGHRDRSAGRDGCSCSCYRRRLAMEERIALGEGRLLLLLMLHGDRSREQPSQSEPTSRKKNLGLARGGVKRQESDVAANKTLQSSSKSICDKPTTTELLDTQETENNHMREGN